MIEFFLLSDSTQFKTKRGFLEPSLKLFINSYLNTSSSQNPLLEIDAQPMVLCSVGSLSFSLSEPTNLTQLRIGVFLLVSGWKASAMETPFLELVI